MRYNLTIIFEFFYNPLYFILIFFVEDGKDFKLVGDGTCRTRCDMEMYGKPCSINQFFKVARNFDDCKLACKTEAACTGFAITDSTHPFPNECTVYGNISSANVAIWADPDSWSAYPIHTDGFEGFNVYLSSGESGAKCYKRQESPNNGKFYSRYEQN